MISVTSSCFRGSPGPVDLVLGFMPELLSCIFFLLDPEGSLRDSTAPYWTLA